MRAVVLVGGEGTRLRPLTLTTPKQMLPIVEQPMIERVLGHLATHGIDDAVLSLGYRPDAFINAYPSGTIAGVALTYAVEPTPLDTAGAIRFAANHAGIDDTFVVVNGDVLTDSDISALIDFHRSSGAEGTISLTPVEDPSAFGVVPTDPQGRVEAFIEKPPRDEAPTNYINAGTYVFETSVLDRIPADRRVSIERETFPALVESGTLYALGSEAYWLDTGTPDAYLRGPPGPAAGPPELPSGPVGRPRSRAGTRVVEDRRRRRPDRVGGPVALRDGLVGSRRSGGRGVGDRRGRSGGGGGHHQRVRAPSRGPGGLQGERGGLGGGTGRHRRPTVRDPRPLGDRRRSGNRLGHGH